MGVAPSTFQVSERAGHQLLHFYISSLLHTGARPEVNVVFWSICDSVFVPVVWHSSSSARLWSVCISTKLSSSKTTPSFHYKQWKVEYFRIYFQQWRYCHSQMLHVWNIYLNYHTFKPNIGKTIPYTWSIWEGDWKVNANQTCKTWQHYSQLFPKALLQQKTSPSLWFSERSENCEVGFLSFSDLQIRWMTGMSISHRISYWWYIYLHLVDLYGKRR